MLDLIRQSAVPANLMRAAARGALSLPVPETLEILVYLTGHSVFGQQAQLTLAGWDKASALAVVSDPSAHPDVLEYFIAPQNHRPDLLTALLENPVVPETQLIEIAQGASRELLSFMLASSRICAMPAVLAVLSQHPALTQPESLRIAEALKRAGVEEPSENGFLELSQYLRDHASEIASEQGKPFQLIDSTSEELAEVAAARAKTPGVSALAAHALGASSSSQTHERISPVQKVARLNVGERVQLALKGNRDERFILIRDGAKVVSSAVLESPKITDSEVEMFASMKNVSDTVLRGIASKRKFMKNYAVKRLLSANPRCPIDVALPLVKELLVMDLKNLSMNKNVCDTVRRFAWKMWKEKTTAQH